jgi:hypothetical protein
MVDLRTTYLLGAGASVDAKLPTSTELTRLITAEIDNANRYGGEAQALHIAIGAMVAHDTGQGGRAFAGIDVERLFSAIRMLADRNTLDIAPFVASWNQNLDGVGGRRLPPAWGSNFRKQLDDTRFGDSGLERVFKGGVEAVSGASDLGPVITRLQSRMIAALGKILAVDPADVSYLEPLLSESHSPIQIATLNYDRSVELLAENTGTAYDTGIRNWDGGYSWSWNQDAEMRLLKLHGSLDWYLLKDPPGDKKLRADKVSLAEDLDDEKRRLSSDQLALVFGQGAKLRSDGPFLAMLVEFDRMLKKTDRLVIVGYSFRDDHINAAVRRWHNERVDPSIVIINPALADWEDYRQAPGFYGELSEVMHAQARPNALNPAHRLIAKGAAEGLQELNQHP